MAVTGLVTGMVEDLPRSEALPAAPIPIRLLDPIAPPPDPPTALSLTLLSHARRALSRATATPNEKGYPKCRTRGPFYQWYAHRVVMMLMCREYCHYPLLPTGLPDGFQVEHQDHNRAHFCPSNLILLQTELHAALSSASRWSHYGREVERLAAILGSRDLARQEIREREAAALAGCPF